MGQKDRPTGIGETIDAILLSSRQFDGHRTSIRPGQGGISIHPQSEARELHDLGAGTNARLEFFLIDIDDRWNLLQSIDIHRVQE